ncbi:TPA: hypothetical protein N0F65_005603 [Lagenidium giganteum]|uniref:Uncharacterized protein n=1 Tax=Lagenidium giganteum TaxID=4803 RepID=A0AAV2Z7V6_9STRA|nr:TPA: hypothetical protein N0F65_005603 [Lagenidium giganteum]
MALSHGKRRCRISGCYQ